jgi:hypothetical protein
MIFGLGICQRPIEVIENFIGGQHFFSLAL